MDQERIAVFLCIRRLEDRIGPIGYKIEKFIWGDGRALHAFLMIWPLNDNHLTVIEIGVTSSKKMILDIQQVDDFLPSIVQIEFLGVTSYKLKNLINDAKLYTKLNRHYNAIFNNCRSLVECLLYKIPEFNSLPRKKRSVLEYYHQQSKLNYQTKTKRQFQTNKKQKLYKSIIHSLQVSSVDVLTKSDDS
ncbi:unnamed protein product [Didymodactylos carnosus]|uniref:Uncharacterized protein n=2 Tax=Didymodactylos carnosus TaxID=1234261 RepID=A0A815ZQB6_9BILA|nr:unnamed protein product [Didymodactylos carnosus]CAF4458251.1 unnamed protein product [Didymodactylos carnosus]